MARMIGTLACLRAEGNGRLHQINSIASYFDGDCSVGILDLLILLGNWG